MRRVSSFLLSQMYTSACCTARSQGQVGERRGFGVCVRSTIHTLASFERPVLGIRKWVSLQQMVGASSSSTTSASDIRPIPIKSLLLSSHATPCIKGNMIPLTDVRRYQPSYDGGLSCSFKVRSAFHREAEVPSHSTYKSMSSLLDQSLIFS